MSFQSNFSTDLVNETSLLNKLWYSILTFPALVLCLLSRTSCHDLVCFSTKFNILLIFGRKKLWSMVKI